MAGRLVDLGVLRPVVSTSLLGKPPLSVSCKSTVLEVFALVFSCPYEIGPYIIDGHIWNPSNPQLRTPDSSPR